MPVDLRLATAILAGRSAGVASRLLHRGGGTTLPGDVALALDTKVLDKLAAGLERGTVLVTGTNGKTTTTALLAAMVRAQGRRVLTNHAGSNLLFGLVAAAVGDALFDGRSRSDTAVFEVDELAAERVVWSMHPRRLLLLNLMRDQLDRSGELHTTAERIGAAVAALPSDALVVANADDPLVVWQCRHAPAVRWFGIDDVTLSLAEQPHTMDARACPQCGAPLCFERIFLGHCGHWRCTGCALQRPEPHVRALQVELPSPDALRLVLGDGLRFEVGVGGVYNVYNALAAATAATTLEVSPAALTTAAAGFRARFGRQEVITLHGRRMRLQLAKNPTGFDEALRAADELSRARTYLIAINDRVADGRDVSWLWDVDFERLARSPQAPRIVVSGRRAEDLAVRLKYAGVAARRVVALERDPNMALRRVAPLAQPNEEIAVLATYTAMLELRAVAENAGAVAPYWLAAQDAT